MNGAGKYEARSSRERERRLPLPVLERATIVRIALDQEHIAPAELIPQVPGESGKMQSAVPEPVIAHRQAAGTEGRSQSRACPRNLLVMVLLQCVDGPQRVPRGRIGDEEWCFLGVENNSEGVVGRRAALAQNGIHKKQVADELGA